MLCPDTIKSMVASALKEDIGAIDVSASLLKNNVAYKANLIAREEFILCGVAYAEEVLLQVDKNITVKWYYKDGDRVNQGSCIAKMQGPVSLLTAERTMINFLQTLSATATVTKNYVDAVENKVKIYDTRKTIPGYRQAQKYAVRVGGGCNQRHGLYDGFLIKENHIAFLGSIKSCVDAARATNFAVPLQVEVENLEQLSEALSLGVDLILLDNFSIDSLNKAVAINQGRAILEASGNINLSNVMQVANTGVDRISIGALTKNIKAIDLSLIVEC